MNSNPFNLLALMVTAVAVVNGSRTCYNLVSLIDYSCASMDLSNNDIGELEAALIADTLKENTAITSVDLSRNSIGNSGAASIAEALNVNTAITSVDLSHNQIGANGIASIAEALNVNTVITHMDLSKNTPDCVVSGNTSCPYYGKP